MTEIKAPMRGKVAEIRVGPGDTVREDDEVLVLHSMKTEVFVYSPGDGVVRELHVKEGDLVEERAVLMVLE